MMLVWCWFRLVVNRNACQNLIWSLSIIITINIKFYGSQKMWQEKKLIPFQVFVSFWTYRVFKSVLMVIKWRLLLLLEGCALARCVWQKDLLNLSQIDFERCSLGANLVMMWWEYNSKGCGFTMEEEVLALGIRIGFCLKLYLLLSIFT